MRQTAFRRLAARVASELGQAGFRPAETLPKALILEEIAASAALAGARLAPEAVAALVDRGIVSGTHLLADCVAVADYARAAQFVREAPPAGRRRTFLRTEEVVELHARAAERSPRARPGLWRDVTIRPFPSGMVAPPPWLIPREIEALVERLVAGPPPDRPPLLWVAQSHERFERLHPFSGANGRVGRLVANLLLRRCGLPPLVLRPRPARRYLPALRAADSGDPWPLAELFAQSVLDTLARFRAPTPHDELQAISGLGAGAGAAALYKAAQRGRLRTARVGGRLLTTRGWLDEYLASRGSRA